MSKPSAGAMRAAKRFHAEGGRSNEELARVIDQETGLPGLLYAANLCYRTIDVFSSAEEEKMIREAIAKAEGREGT